MTNKQFSGFCHSCMSQKEKQELLIASFAHSRAQGVWIALDCYTPLSTMLFQKRQHIPVPSLHWSHSPQCLAIFGCSQHGRNLQQMTTGSHILLGSSPQLLHWNYSKPLLLLKRQAAPPASATPRPVAAEFTRSVSWRKVRKAEWKQQQYSCSNAKKYMQRITFRFEAAKKHVQSKGPEMWDQPL